jgi:hypothetical protein
MYAFHKPIKNNRASAETPARSSFALFVVTVMETNCLR